MAQAPLPKDAEPLNLLRESNGHTPGRLLTIVIGAYNHQRFLAEAFTAIEHSGVCDQLALIIIDDGSTDNTIPFTCDYPFDPSLHVRIFAKKNAGLRDSLASGLALTETPFIAFMASDDLYVPAGLAAIIDRLARAKTQDICWVAQATYLEGRDGEIVYGSAIEATLSAHPKRRERELSVQFPKPLLLQSTVFGTDILRAIKPWVDGLTLDDWPTFIMIARLARHRMVDIRPMFDILLCRYRIHEGGSHNNLERQLRICLEVAERTVAPCYRREATANVLADIALIHLYQRDYRTALHLLYLALKARCSPATVARPTARIFSSAVKRLVTSVKD